MKRLSNCVSVLVVTAFIVIVGTCSAFAQDEKPWQERLPVSMNGNLPDGLPDGFELKYWHSLRLRFPNNAADFDIKKLSRHSFFSTENGKKLQKAILDSDIASLNKLIEQGADVNEKGQEGITPLYLAMFVDTDPRPFEVLKENGADPNVYCFSTVVLGAGLTVSHLAAMPEYNRLFEFTFQTQADPNLSGTVGVPFAATRNQPDAVERLKYLAKKGANLNLENGSFCGSYLPDCLLFGFLADNEASRERQYKLAKVAVDNGADYTAWSRPRHPAKAKQTGFEDCNFQPIHYLALAAIEDKESFQEGSAAKALLVFLEKNGQSLEQAKNDLSRWKEWHENGLDKLIRLEHKIRLADKTGEKLKKWQAEELPKQRAKLEKELRDRWDDPKWRIQRLPVSTLPAPAMSEHNVSRWQHHFWSDIVKSELIQPRPFELLLESGANPNVPNQAKHEQKGLAVVHVVAKPLYCRHFKTVFENGGDPNLKALGRTPIGYILLDCFDWVGRVEFLCEQGADINQAAPTPIALLIACDWLNNTSKRGAKRSREPQMLTAIKAGAALDFQMKTWLQSPRYPEKGVEPKIGKCALELPHILIELYAPHRVDAELKSLTEAKGFSFEQAEEELKEWRRLIATGESPLNAKSEKKKNRSPR